MFQVPLVIPVRTDGRTNLIFFFLVLPKVVRVGAIFTEDQKVRIFDPALLDLEVAIAKNVVHFHRNE